ncbi:MAG: exonuclease [Candidatus Lokiarchaeota archaeon]|nr:exonuclease [Candidatus Lokiarchaeota archaeon]
MNTNDLLDWGNPDNRIEDIIKNSAITSCFSFVKGIGAVSERRIHGSGIKNWDLFSKYQEKAVLKLKKWKMIKKHIPIVKKALETKNVPQIRKLIPNNQHWRMIPNFINDIAYLDIETTGLSYYRHKITTIGVFDGTKVHTFVRGDNLDEFPQFIKNFKAIASYNGKQFDVPFIENEMRFRMDHIHFDLRFLLQRVGLKGGLKKIEQKLGISRPESAGLDGFAAVVLWKKYKKTKDKKYLETLLAYNAEDVINLEILLYQAYNKNLKKEQLEHPMFYFKPKNVENPYNADRTVVYEVSRSFG